MNATADMNPRTRDHSRNVHFNDTPSPARSSLGLEGLISPRSSPALPTPAASPLKGKGKGDAATPWLSHELARLRSAHADLERNFVHLESEVDRAVDAAREAVTQMMKVKREASGMMDSVKAAMELIEQAERVASHSGESIHIQGDASGGEPSVPTDSEGDGDDAVEANNPGGTSRLCEYSDDEPRVERRCPFPPHSSTTSSENDVSALINRLDDVPTPGPSQRPVSNHCVAGPSSVGALNSSPLNEEGRRMSPRFRAAERLRISRAKVVMTAWPKSKELDKTVVEIDRQMDEGRMRRREKRRRAEDAAEVVKETDAASPTDPSKKQPAAFTFGHSVPVKLSAFGPVLAQTPPNRGRVLVPDSDDAVFTGAAPYATPCPSPPKRRRCVA